MMMRNLRSAALAALATIALPAGAGAQGDPTMSGAGSEARAVSQADSIRGAILGYATFAGFADAECAPGDVRTFERDTSGAAPKLLRRLESLIASYAAFESLDTDAGRALLRAVARLETGGPGPRWDVLTGTGPRAFNPLLPTTLLNPMTGACEDTPGSPPFGLILPPLTGFEPPKDSGAAPYLVEHGPEGVRRVRDAFASIHVGDTAAVLRHTRVNAYALWGDYAIVGVVREAEDRGVIPMPDRRTGAVYAFHRVDGEWRLLALVRNW
jgi:hypothetical protein